MVPALDGVSETISPLAIMMRIGNSDYQQLRVEFGAYAMVFEDNNPTKTAKIRTKGAISLAKTGNWQGDYNFVCLVTGKYLARHKWTELPMSNQIIDAIERWALAKVEHIIFAGCPVSVGMHSFTLRLIYKKISKAGSKKQAKQRSQKQ